MNGASRTQIPGLAGQAAAATGSWLAKEDPTPPASLWPAATSRERGLFVGTPAPFAPSNPDPGPSGRPARGGSTGVRAAQKIENAFPHRRRILDIAGRPKRPGVQAMLRQSQLALAVGGGGGGGGWSLGPLPPRLGSI